jgi:adenylosuccinate synthase
MDGKDPDRTELQEFGDQLDERTDHKWLLDAVVAEVSDLPATVSVVVDNVRTAKQLEAFRQHGQLSITHVHLYASPKAELLKRFRRRNSSLDEESAKQAYDQADLLKQTADIDSFVNDADVRVNTVRTDARDTVVRVAARLGLLSPPDTRCVDVVVGGQFGSEGKGHVAAYLAKDYDVLVRVGGPNAGHTVSSASGVYTYHQLPSGAKDTDARLLLGPGMTINVEKLLNEISDCGIGPERLFIDPQAMIIEASDIAAETGLKDSISSTGQGGGSAAARRITGRGDKTTRLARDIEQLIPFVGTAPDYRGSTLRQLEIAYSHGQSILLEGTQGSGLSIFHGAYPYVTSRDTNVAGCLAEAGISPSRVRRVIMVTRLTPIRVADPDGSTSGPLKHEVSFDIVATEAHLDPDEVKGHEKTSTTHRPRRVGWFEWEGFRRACELNGPTDIVLTFADYVHSDNQKARRFEQLTRDTIKFVEELERVAQAPVSLINTRFPRNPNEDLDVRTIIDRRNWSTTRRALPQSTSAEPS